MRVAFIPWIALSVVVVASAEPIETITRDISLTSRSESLHSRNVIGLSLGDDLKLGIPVGNATPVRFATEQPPD